ncbi:unnamed protein product [Ranitomeya imitator]|uniref:Uncharacterized protein n=1 Tax=Ranitomeya imitator TaxID=111125 RepID=A0ABN9LTJ9_9NEOB|nr:unnamed protein product [Ranitomeya imitator]
MQPDTVQQRGNLNSRGCTPSPSSKDFVRQDTSSRQQRKHSDLAWQRHSATTQGTLSVTIRREVHIFYDASTETIAAVAYLKTLEEDNKVHCGFILVELVEAIKDEMDIAIDSFTFYTNSKVVPVTSDPDAPMILTPATLLTQKVGAAAIPPGKFADGDIYRGQWKQVYSDIPRGHHKNYEI